MTIRKKEGNKTCSISPHFPAADTKDNSFI